MKDIYKALKTGCLLTATFDAKSHPEWKTQIENIPGVEWVEEGHDPLDDDRLVPGAFNIVIANAEQKPNIQAAINSLGEGIQLS